mgnify:FL=1|tara:strand:- start:531 stop:725 length:195 start_codon:yes stop_codon:yes gene_type:complete
MIDLVQSMGTPVEHRVIMLERELNFAHKEIEHLNKVTKMHRQVLKQLDKGLREKFKKIEEKINV